MTGVEELNWAFSSTPDDWIAMLPESVRWRYQGSGRRVRRIVDQARSLWGETEALAEVMAEPDIPDTELATVAAPTLLCYGSETPAPGARDRLLANVSDVQLKTFNSSHFLPLEAPAELTEAMVDFLNG